MTESYLTAPANAVSTLRVSWSAVFAGGAIAFASYLILSVLETAIGAGAMDPMAEGTPCAASARVRGDGCSSASCSWWQPVPGWPAVSPLPAGACMVC